MGFLLSASVFMTLVIVAYLLYDYWKHSYWRRRGVLHDPSTPLFGSAIFRKGFPDAFTVGQAKYGKVYGVYTIQIPTLVVGDIDMLRHICVKNFIHFHNRVFFPQVNKELMSGVGVLEGERWKEVRNVLTPTFSSSKMKQMSPLVNESCDHLVEYIGIRQKESGFIECRELFGAFVMDTIGSCAFGLKLNPHADTKDPFVSHAKRAFSFNFQTNFFFFIGLLFPSLGKILASFNIGVFFPPDVATFFKEVLLKAVELRQSSATKRVDFLQLMLDTRNVQEKEATQKEAEDEKDIHDDLDAHHDVQFHAKKLNRKIRLTDEELVGQAITFFTAGYETTSSLLGFIFYALATHPEVQEKLIQEVDELTPTRDSVGYTSVASMPYLDQVVCETLRHYPPAVLMNRTCNETFEYQGMVIEKGVDINIPIYNIHHDPDYWPEPEKFDPSRFTKSEREKRHPFAWIPFGAGPRNCIGMRFALMETKMAVARVLQKYRVETGPQTEIPPILGKSGFLFPPNGISLRAVSRDDVTN